MAKRSALGALEAKPEVEIWRRPVFPTQRPRLPIRLRILYAVYLTPLRLYNWIILALAHCNGCGFGTQKYDLSRFFQLRAYLIRLP